MDIVGLGFILYSQPSADHIKEGENYLIHHYNAVPDVLQHIYKGLIVGFCTGSPGRFIIEMRDYLPNVTELNSYDYKLRLGLHVKNNQLRLRDLYDLLQWVKACPEKQTIYLENGFYSLIVCSSKPESGIRGDNQKIVIYFSRAKELPQLKYKGVPRLYTVSEMS